MGETDLISRQAAIDALDSFILDETTDVHGDTVREILERLPTIEERKTGKWIAYDWNTYRCSCCGKQIITNPDYIKEHKFCFGCGADLRGDDHEND